MGLLRESLQEILAEMPDLETEDIVACLQFVKYEKETADEYGARHEKRNSVTSAYAKGLLE